MAARSKRPPFEVPHEALEHVVSAVRGDSESGKPTLRLVLSDENLSLRDLARYAEALDRVYGTVRIGDLRSYSHRKHDHVRVARVEPGSWQLVVDSANMLADNYQGLVALWIFAKHLGTLFKDVAAGSASIEAARLDRQTRLERDRSAGSPSNPELRAALENDPQLRTLSQQHRVEIASLMNELAERESSRIQAAARFSEESVLRVELEVDADEEPPAA